MKKIFLTLIILLTHTACTPNTELQPKLTITSKPPPTQSNPPLPTSSVTPTSTLTQLPPLSPQGPYLMYDTSSWLGEGPFMILSADGTGSRLFELPDGGYIHKLQNSVSPDGEWLAYFTGSIESPYDLVLNLLDISDSSVRNITPLFSNDYVQNLYIIAETLPITLNTPTIESWIIHLEQALTSGIMELAWSPDGSQLAFAGQIDGPSSDLYIYDLDTNTIKRKTDDLRHIFRIEWSPDGQYVLFTNSIPGAIYQGATLQVINPDDEDLDDSITLESGFWWMGAGWLSPNLYLIIGISDGGSPHNLRYVNIETSETTYLWPDTYVDYAIDFKNNLVALSSAPSEYGSLNSSTNTEDGLFLLSLDGNQRKISEEIFWNLIFHGGTESYLVGTDGENILEIADDGATTFLSDRFDNFGRVRSSTSPDRRWLVLFNEFGFDIFSESSQLIRTIIDINVSGIIWHPDSEGFFFFTDENNLYYISILDGDPLLVDLCPGEDCAVSKYDFVWLP
ncbi:MAG: hypothetical protein FVQ83_11385 [Chloroflexi bacterium]|nr:hypothetical protein [Chloroflexota bacterium]